MRQGEHAVRGGRVRLVRCRLAVRTRFREREARRRDGVRGLSIEFPVETSQAPLFQLLGTPAEDKRHVVFEDAGHVPPRIAVIREILDWLDRYLGPVGTR